MRELRELLAARATTLKAMERARTYADHELARQHLLLVEAGIEACYVDIRADRELEPA